MSLYYGDFFLCFTAVFNYFVSLCQSKFSVKCDRTVGRQREREREHKVLRFSFNFRPQHTASDRLNKAKAWNVKINQSHSTTSPRTTRWEGREKVSECRAEEVSTRERGCYTSKNLALLAERRLNGFSQKQELHLPLKTHSNTKILDLAIISTTKITPGCC